MHRITGLVLRCMENGGSSVSRGTSVRITGFLLAVVAAWPLRACIPDALAEVTVLDRAKTIERELSAGQAHEYSFALQEGEYAKLTLFEYSINVAVECFGPDGKPRFDADSHRIDDTEIVELIGDSSGSYLLRVTAPDRHAPAGRYDITLREVEAAAERHRARIAAARAYADAWKLVKVMASRGNLLKAIGNFETAVKHRHIAEDLLKKREPR
jgi:hypothetical protein